MEGLAVHVVIRTTIVAVPVVVVVSSIMVGTVPASVFVGVRHTAACLVVAFGVGVGAVLVVMSTRATPKAVLQGRALKELMVGIELLAFAAAKGVGKGAAVGTVARGGFVVELRHVDYAGVVDRKSV